MIKEKNMKTEYRIKRIYDGVRYSYLQFKDNKGKWRYVPRTVDILTSNEIENQFDCIIGDDDPIHYFSGLFYYGFTFSEYKLKDFIVEYPNIDDYIKIMIERRKNYKLNQEKKILEYESKENQIKRNEEREYVENNKYEYLK